jgi:hypothetical protein
MGATNVDNEIRKSVARWAYAVSVEEPTTPAHATRVIVARKMIEGVSPAVSADDSVMTHVVFLVRAFAARGDDSDVTEINAAVDLVLGTCVKLGAFAS